MTLKVTDRFTTQHGSWDVDPSKPYGIDQAHRDKYEAGRLIPGAGADHHIFVNAKQGDAVRFLTLDSTTPQDEIFTISDSSGWLNFPIFGGPWLVWVNGELIADDIAMPGGQHVSTFLVVSESEEGSQPVPPQGREIMQVVIRTFIDGNLTKEEILWQG